MTPRLSIAVYYELICPWCWIGKRNLEAALHQLSVEEPSVDVQVQWHGVQLLPDLPAHGLPFPDFYLRRLGSPEAVLMRQAQVQAAAREAGLHIDFSRIALMPNTAKVHGLLAFAAQHCSAQQQQALIEDLFRAHFALGRDLGCSETLRDMACAHELDGQLALAGMESEVPQRHTNVPDGVPCFVFNGKASLSGAQAPQVLLNGMRQAIARESLVGAAA